MLKELFGSRSTEQIFLNLAHSGELHLSAISKNSGIGATALLRKLNELESIGILVSRQFGRTRLYSFNPILTKLNWCHWHQFINLSSLKYSDQKPIDYGGHAHF